MKQIIAVDPAVLREFASVDEDESEAVALAFMELLFAETNAFYEQHSLTRRTITRLSGHLAGNVVDAIFAAVLQSEASIPQSSFHSEVDPEPCARDRHSVRNLPCRSPDERQQQNQNDAMSNSSEKLQMTVAGVAPSLSRESRGSSSPEKLEGTNSSIGLPRTRRRAADKAVPDRSVSHLAIPEIQELPEEEDENPDTRAWRAHCLKELTSSSKKRQSILKWATVARAFAPANSDAKMSMEVEIVESTPPLLQKEVLLISSSSTSSIRMKSNVDSFSNVVDLVPHGLLLSGDGEQLQHTSQSHWSQLTSGDSLYDNAVGYSTKSRKSVSLLQSGRASSKSGKAVTTKKSGSGVMHLNDKLSRKRSIVNGGAGGSAVNGGNNSSTRRLWKYEGEGTRVVQPFTSEVSGFNATALPSTIQLASGVVLSQGESLVEGPARVESPNTMSRKRFDLHQSLATDQLLHWPKRDSLLSVASSLSFHHHQEHNHHQLKPYEEVPAEPIPVPYLSPIPTSALAIPRTHLAQSLSAPALRVRSPTNSKQNSPGPSLASSVSSSTSSTNDGGFAKHRPRTALLMGKLSNPVTAGGSSSGTLAKKNARGGSAGNSARQAAKYLREFPKPQPGIVKLSQIEDSQRLAWIS